MAGGGWLRGGVSAPGPASVRHTNKVSPCEMIIPSCVWPLHSGTTQHKHCLGVTLVMLPSNLPTHHLHCLTQPVTVMLFITTMYVVQSLAGCMKIYWLVVCFESLPCVGRRVSFCWLGVYQSVAQQWKMENQSNISCEGHPLIPRSTSSPGSGGLPGGGHRCQAGTPTPHWNITRR